MQIVYLLSLLVYMELVNTKYKTDFDILYLPLVRNTEQQFRKGLKFGLFLIVLFLAPLLFIKLYFGISLFQRCVGSRAANPDSRSAFPTESTTPTASQPSSSPYT